MPEPSRNVRPAPPRAASQRPGPPLAKSLIQAPRAPPPVSYDPGYAAMGMPAPVFVQVKPSWTRPGSATAAAVIAFIVGGMSLVVSMTWFMQAKVAGRTSLFGIDAGTALLFGIIDLAVAWGLIVGAAGLLGRQEWGRLLLYAGAGLDALFSSYRLAAWFGDMPGSGSPLNLLFAVLDVTVIVCLALPLTTAYLRTRHPLQGMNPAIR